MKLDGILEYSKEIYGFTSLVEKAKGRVWAIEEARPFVVASLFKAWGKPVLLVSARPDSSRNSAEQLQLWLDQDVVLHFPEPTTLPYQNIEPDPAGEMEAIACLAAIRENRSPQLVVASIQSVITKRPSARTSREAVIHLKVGARIPPLSMVARLDDLGYTASDLVETPGQFGRRGGILDIFPPTLDRPVRLEYFGDAIESIRYFNPESQRSLANIDSISVGITSSLAPVFSKAQDQDGRLGLNCNDTLLDYLPADCVILIEDIADLKMETESLDNEARKTLRYKIERHEIAHDVFGPYFPWSEIGENLAVRASIELVNWRHAEEKGVLRLGIQPIAEKLRGLNPWIETACQINRSEEAAVTVSHQAPRLFEMLSEKSVETELRQEIDSKPTPGRMTLVQGILAGGWRIDHRFWLFTDRDLFGFSKTGRITHKKPVARKRQLFDIKPNDFVVHIEHGIGRYAGTVNRVHDGISREYLAIHYAGGDRLYVPTDQIDRVERFIGASDNPPVLNHLGSLDWIRTKNRAREAAQDIAAELLDLYAAREVQPGFAFSPDGAWQIEMESAFPYIETPDQLLAIEQVKADMYLAKPMDRLICGDVGYGKTEVALRAAFKAVMDGKQVAILVPTTILAQQHYDTFSERLAVFPVRVELLSRFRSQREQTGIAEGLAAGKVDIVIGTHRLLQKDIVFQDLGLLVIDEEQRFGVVHKEYLKNIRKEVDVLTLSATPIPRTLHLSLAGVRDMSVIETPPENRLPIRTIVAEYDNNLVREAVMREMERSGQVYFVHNRVQNIMMVADKLRRLLPEVRIDVGHGQMNEDRLARVMSDFVAKKIDLLLCTTIIESGLDVPNANTLIVNNADKMGLTQLYQLRGRVGRGANSAYAYCLYEKGKLLTQDAEQRLRTIYEATELGAGFGLAMKDLEIRGAGNILGVRQSGHINAVGFNLYTQLLSEAVEDMKKRRTAEAKGKPFIQEAKLPPPVINLPMPAFIPEDYIEDVNARLGMYQRMAAADNFDKLEGFVSELRDRFGELPQPVINLIYIVETKILAARSRLVSVIQEGESVILRPPPSKPFEGLETGKTIRGVRASMYQIKLNLAVLGTDWRIVLHQVLRQLATAAGVEAGTAR